MQNLTSTFSISVVRQIIVYIINQSLNQKFTKLLLSTNNPLSKQFYSSFIDQTVEQTIFSGIFPTKFQQFELSQRPKYVQKIDEQPVCQQIHVRRFSQFSKILSKKSTEKQIRLKSLTSVKMITNQKKVSSQKLQSLMTEYNKQNSIKRKYFFKNQKQKNKNLIKLQNQNESKEQQSTTEIQKLHEEMRKKRIQQKIIPIKTQKSMKIHHLLKKKSRSQPNQSFPLFQNVNQIKFEILDRENKQKINKSKIQHLKINRNSKDDNTKVKLYHSKSCAKVTNFSENKKLQQQKQSNSKLLRSNKLQVLMFDQNNLKNQQQRSDQNKRKSQQKLMIQKNIQKAQQNSLTIFGARQRRASQVKLHSEAIKKIEQCKTKNILKIKTKKLNQNLKAKMLSKESHQKLIINNENCVDFLLNSSRLEQSSIVIQNGIPNLSQENKGRISIKLI